MTLGGGGRDVVSFITLCPVETMECTKRNNVPTSGTGIANRIADYQWKLIPALLFH
ncbi:MAG: hypothetical protein ABSH06_22735 [Thermodesulfobacteriota bacterium]|jgi:hypothetical protein